MVFYDTEIHNEQLPPIGKDVNEKQWVVIPTHSTSIELRSLPVITSNMQLIKKGKKFILVVVVRFHSFYHLQYNGNMIENKLRNK